MGLSIRYFCQERKKQKAEEKGKDSGFGLEEGGTPENKNEG